MPLANTGATAITAVNPLVGAAVSTVLHLLPPNRARTPEENRAYRQQEIKTLLDAARVGNMAALAQVNTWLLDGGLHSDPRVGLAGMLADFYRTTGRIPPANVAQALGISQSNTGGMSTLPSGTKAAPTFGVPQTSTIPVSNTTVLVVLGVLLFLALKS